MCLILQGIQTNRRRPNERTRRLYVNQLIYLESIRALLPQTGGHTSYSRTNGKRSVPYVLHTKRPQYHSRLSLTVEIPLIDTKNDRFWEEESHHSMQVVE